MQNPLNLIDPKGMEPEEGGGDPKKYKFNNAFTPKFSLRIGDSGGPWGEEQSTSIISLVGNKTYYNSDASKRGGSFPRFDEPNSFIQAQVRIGGEDSNYQIGINWFKEKFRNENGFGFEAPTAVQGSFGINNLNVIIDGKFSVTTNLSFGVGIELGIPRSDNPSEDFGKGYRVIGYGASAIYRADASYKGFNVFVAATLHGLQTTPVTSNITTHSGETIGSMGLRFGVGYNFGR